MKNITSPPAPFLNPGESNLAAEFANQSRQVKRGTPVGQILRDAIEVERNPVIQKATDLQSLAREFYLSRIEEEAKAAIKARHRTYLTPPWRAPLEQIQGYLTQEKWVAMCESIQKTARDFIQGQQGSHGAVWALADFQADFFTYFEDRPAGYDRNEGSPTHGRAIMERHRIESMVILLKFVDLENAAPTVYRNGIEVDPSDGGGNWRAILRELSTQEPDPTPLPTPAEVTADPALLARVEAAEARAAEAVAQMARMEALLRSLVERDAPPPNPSTDPEDAAPSPAPTPEPAPLPAEPPRRGRGRPPRAPVENQDHEPEEGG